MAAPARITPTDHVFIEHRGRFVLVACTPQGTDRERVAAHVNTRLNARPPSWCWEVAPDEADIGAPNPFPCACQRPELRRHWRLFLVPMEG